MKKLHISAVALAVAVASAPFARANEHGHGHEAAAVVNPRIPSKVEFAGHTVSLDRPDLYERLDRELTAMSFTHGNTLLQIKRANRYFPVMEPILKKNGIPADLLYLACIESTLNPRAVSPAKAAGLWQFMPTTAKEYGLEVNEWVDERFDPEKSTEAACRYLKNAYNRYGSWENAVASYNAGMGRISNELNAQDVNSAYDLWLPDETMRYVFRILAAKLIMEHPRHFGYRLEADQLYTPVDCRVEEVDGPVDDWAAWALEHGSNYYELRLNNPWIRSRSLPNKSGKVYLVKLPAGNQSKAHRQANVYRKEWIGK